MKRTVLILVVITAAIMELIDTSIVNVALSHMSGNLGATLEDTSWVITAYAIANVIIIPITGFLSATLGRRNYYIGSIIAFTLFSFLCGQASNIWILVLFRFLQGIGGGALLSVSQVIIFEQFPKEKQNVAGALFGVGVFVGPTIGPTLGGYITEFYSWPWIFYINVPIGIIVTILCLLLLKEPAIPSVRRKIDWTGILLLALGVSALQTVLERGETDDWFEAPYITWLTVIATFSIMIFIWWELRIKEPVVNLRVLKSRNLSIAAILTFVSGMGIFSSVFLTPVFAQRLLNFTPLQTGLLLLPGACLAIGGLMISARLLQRGLSPVFLIVAGMGLFILFSWQMSQLNQDANAASISWYLVCRGVGLALVTVPLTTLAVSALSPADIPQGAALNNMMRQLGGSFGIALVNTYLANRHAQHRYDLVSHLDTNNPAIANRINNYAHAFMSKGFTATDAQRQAVKLLDNIVVKQSTLLSFSDAFLLVGLIFLLTLPLLFIASGKKKAAANVVVMDH
ncbi:DHA2 family efflux MFS transporter permease subunit [Chitinophaga polysaccharea]|uniref:DHA2 family efflux MFS transporter permease subunit n=1 Tax=Chitinophaga TaxID=79328 RepID=UPI00145511F5|nr:MULTISPECIES: DHA2 family efflux MFS transporter permease subunit [Chitinophaga]NLR62547.1 DHA2 family efflux MFS transporter permease subunit [Chitinophaga polysaccharea]NLU91519.1 DHA2 family efflux MFS transporter permease subunit [Chitinophaga sp. Ak27]